MLMIHWSPVGNHKKIMANGIAPAQRLLACYRNDDNDTIRVKNIRGVYCYPFLWNKYTRNTWRRILRSETTQDKK